MKIADLYEHWGDGPAGQFLKAYTAWEDASIHDEGFSVELEKRGDRDVYLDYLWVPEDLRTNGYGSKIMQALTHYADEFGVRIHLFPLWQDDEKPSIDLARWYEKFGFAWGEKEMTYTP